MKRWQEECSRQMVASGGHEVAEIFGGQILSFSESLTDASTVVTHRNVGE